ncbi:hypothetical protein L208DRAFT_736673 [Tricholoma matsutake]|nr:hypothetical protein L208DRAFT_736673 [Tricholoma matsutake 945]
MVYSFSQVIPPTHSDVLEDLPVPARILFLVFNQQLERATWDLFQFTHFVSLRTTIERSSLHRTICHLAVRLAATTTAGSGPWLLLTEWTRTAVMICPVLLHHLPIVRRNALSPTSLCTDRPRRSLSPSSHVLQLISFPFIAEHPQSRPKAIVSTPIFGSKQMLSHPCHHGSHDCPCLVVTHSCLVQAALGRLLILERLTTIWMIWDIVVSSPYVKERTSFPGEKYERGWESCEQTLVPSPIKGQHPLNTSETPSSAI